MPNYTQSIRDPIHNFIRITSLEREVINSSAFQRLRYIHQLALTYLVYPAATHRRFEHSLGVMALAGKIYERITSRNFMDEGFLSTHKELLNDESQLSYWESTVRIAALIHDIGHMPFSHAAENLLPGRINHEHMTIHLIKHYIKPILENERPKVEWEDVAKLAVGKKVWQEYVDFVDEIPDNNKKFTPWEEILSEIITGDAFGADRMDYLLRDAYHTGVAYGVFDVHRLVETLKILPQGGEEDYVLGMKFGGVQAAEGLLLARHFMYSQVYFHRVRLIYNYHLQKFMSELYPAKFPTQPDKYLKITDNEILAESRKSKSTHGRIINDRQHYKCVKESNSKSIQHIRTDVEKQFEEDCHVYTSNNRQTGVGQIYFPVESRDGEVISSIDSSEIIRRMPAIDIGYIYVNHKREEEARKYVEGIFKPI